MRTIGKLPHDFQCLLNLHWRSFATNRKPETSSGIVTSEHKRGDRSETGLERGAGWTRELHSLPMDWQAFWLTVRLALLVTGILVVLGFPLACWIAFSRWRWKFLVEALVALPIVLPPTVLGFYVLVALGNRSPLGRWWERMSGHPLAFTFQGLVIGSVIYSLPFAVQPIASSLAGIDRRLMHASAVLGVSRVKTFFRILVPLSLSGLITGVALTFAHTMGEFGVVLMVGGNIPGVTRTLSISIFDQVQDLNYAAANTTALILVAIAFVLLSVVYSLNRTSWNIWRRA
jgi:molybdate transport system permease protein